MGRPFARKAAEVGYVLGLAGPMTASIDIVNRILERWRNGDPALDLFAEDAVWDYSAFPDGRVVRGREGIETFMRRWVGTWDDYELEVEDVIDAGEQVVALTRERGRGKGSDAFVELHGALVFTLGGGEVKSFKGFLDRGKALDSVSQPAD